MKIYAKKAIFFLVFTRIILFYVSSAQAEIINLQKDEKKFGEWQVFCETDTMMQLTHCKVGSKFYDQASAITIEPNSKFFNQFFIVIPKIQSGGFLQARVDDNDLILSRNVKDSDFGLIFLSDEQKNILFKQMKMGDFLFLRFNIRDNNKEITAKISLQDFRNAVAYHAGRSSK